MNARLVLFLILAVVMTVSWLSTCVIWRAAELGERLAPLEERSFGSLTSVVVGSGGGHENPSRMGPSILIGWEQNALLVDVGRGIAEALRGSQIPLSQPRTILLSSLMPENTVGLDDLLLTGWREPRTSRLEVYGPVGTSAFVSGILAAHTAGIAAESEGLGLPAAGVQMVAHEVEPGHRMEIDGLSIRAGGLPGGPTPALAWRFERGGGSIVVVGAGWSPEAMVEIAGGADLLYHEATILPPAEGAEDAGILVDPELLRRQAALHTSLDSVGELAQRAGVSVLALVRMRPPPFYDFQVTGFVGKSFDGEVLVPVDGSEITP